MAKYHKERLKIGFALGFLASLLVVLIVGLVIFIPASSEQQIVALKKVAIATDESEHESKQPIAAADGPLLNTAEAQARIGSSLASGETKTGWRFVEDQRGLIEFKIPAAWSIEYQADNEMILQGKNGSSTGIKIWIEKKNKQSLAKRVQLISGAASSNVHDFYGEAEGLVAEGKIKVIGLEEGKIQIFLTLDSGISDLAAEFKAIAASVRSI